MAIISLSGRQYFVGDKAKLQTLKLDKKEGETFDVKDEISGKTIKLKVIKHGKGPKTRVMKFKRKTNYKRIYGDRFSFTEVEVI